MLGLIENVYVRSPPKPGIDWTLVCDGLCCSHHGLPLPSTRAWYETLLIATTTRTWYVWLAYRM